MVRPLSNLGHIPVYAQCQTPIDVVLHADACSAEEQLPSTPGMSGGAQVSAMTFILRHLGVAFCQECCCTSGTGLQTGLQSAQRLCISACRVVPTVLLTSHGTLMRSSPMGIWQALPAPRRPTAVSATGNVARP